MKFQRPEQKGITYNRISDFATLRQCREDIVSVTTLSMCLFSVENLKADPTFALQCSAIFVLIEPLLSWHAMTH